jgi:hypothetical protein
MVGTRIKFQQRRHDLHDHGGRREDAALSAATPTRSRARRHDQQGDRHSGPDRPRQLARRGFLEGQLIKLDGIAACHDGNGDGSCLTRSS